MALMPKKRNGACLHAPLGKKDERPGGAVIAARG
jgi:hypothetical protein